MIEAFRIGAAFPDRTLWDGLDLSFGEGEVCVVTGPPGCGKTLLLKILRGARRPDAGDVVAGDGGEGHQVGIVAASHLVIQGVDGGRMDPHQHLPGVRHWFWHLAEFERIRAAK